MIRMRLALTILTLGSSGLSFAAYTLLLKYLGASSALDLVFYAGSVPLSLSGITTGVLLYVLPPRLAQLRSRTQDAVLRTCSVAVACVAAACGAVAVVAALLGVRPGFCLLLFGYINVAALLVVGTLLTCVAQARAAYLATSMAPLFGSAGLLIGSLAAIVSHVYGLIVLGQLLGAAIGVWGLARAIGVRSGASLARDYRLCGMALRPLRPHSPAIAAGTIAFTLFQPIDALLCTGLTPGAVSILAYAQRVLVATSTVVSLGAHALAARTAHDAFRAGGHAAVRRLANNEGWRIVGFGIACWALYRLTGAPLLEIVFSKSSMTLADQRRLADCLGWMLLGIGPMAAMPYLFKVFYTIRSYREPALVGIGTAVGYAALSGLLLQSHGILSMAYAYPTVWWAALISTMLILNRRRAHA